MHVFTANAGRGAGGVSADEKIKIMQKSLFQQHAFNMPISITPSASHHIHLHVLQSLTCKHLLEFRHLEVHLMDQIY